MKHKRRIRAQSVSEYTLFVAIILIAVIAMNTYVKRGLQGRYADVTDSTISVLRTKTATTDVPAQYEPYYADSQNIVDVPRKIGEVMTASKVTRNLLTEGNTTTATSTNVEKAQVEGSKVLW